MTEKRNMSFLINLELLLKFIYSEKATKFCKIFALLFTGTTYLGQEKGEDFVKFCGLLRIYELYETKNIFFSVTNMCKPMLGIRKGH